MAATKTKKTIFPELAQKRQKWLKNKGLKVRSFTDRLNSKRTPEDGLIEANTTSRWFHDGSTPRNLSRARVIAAFPDFPL